MSFGANAFKRSIWTILRVMEEFIRYLEKIREGFKIKLIILAEFSAKGYPLPPLRKIINFSPTFWMSGLWEGGGVGWSFLCLLF